jgi:MFS family permease
MNKAKLTQLIMLSLLISFGSVGVVCITPGMPEIAHYFQINDEWLGFTISFYLFGYAFGQLIYGALTNRFGGKVAINIGVILTVIGCIGIVYSYYCNVFWVLLFFRVIMALGAASGLKMTFTLVHKLFSTDETPRLLGLLTISFAVIPGVAVYFSSELVEHFGWVAPFYFMIVYSSVIIVLNQVFPDVCLPTKSALSCRSIIKGYTAQFQSRQVIFGGLLLGLGSCFVYVFSTLSPILAMNVMGLSPNKYGAYNLLPTLGILVGSLASNYFGKVWAPIKSLKIGLLVISIGVGCLTILVAIFHNPFSIFAPMIIIYIGLSFIFGNSSTLALKNISDVSNASAVMSFINIFSSVILVICLSNFDLNNILLLPMIFVILCFVGVFWFANLIKAIEK